MALFEGEDIVDVEVGGQVRSIPSSVANALGLQPMTMNAPGDVVIPPAPQAINPTVAPVRDELPANALTTPPPTPPPSQQTVQDILGPPVIETDGAPAIDAVSGPTGPAPVFASPVVTAKQPPAGPQPMTQASLRAGGTAAGLNDQQAAIEGQKAAAQKLVAAESAENEALLVAIENERADTAARDAAKDAEHRDQLIKTEQKRSAVGKMVEKRANVKIDRDIDHPMLAAIGIALGAFAQMRGATGNENVGLKALFASIDRKVAGQMQDLENDDKTIALMKDGLIDFRTETTDKLARRDALTAAAQRQYAITIRKIGLASSSDKLKANAEAAAFVLDEKAATLKVSAADKELARMQHEKDQAQAAKQHSQSIGVQYAGLKQAGSHFDQRLAFDKEKEANDQAALKNAAIAAGNKAAAKDIDETTKDLEGRGINNIARAKPLMNRKGEEMWDQAAKYDDQAKIAREKNPAAADVLEQKARQLRFDARKGYQVKDRDPTAARATSALYESAQGAMTLVDDINKLFDENGQSFINTDGNRAAMQAKSVELLMKMKNVWQLGVLSKVDTTLLTQATGGDMTNGWEVGTFAHNIGLEIGKDPKAFKKRLDSLITGMEKETEAKFKSAGWDGSNPKDLWTREKQPGKTAVDKDTETVLQTKTVAEIKRDDEGGASFKSKEDMASPSGRGGRDREIEEEHAAGSYGFTQVQSNAFGDVMAKHKEGNPQAKEKILQMAKSARGQVQEATMERLHVEDPALYAEAQKHNKYQPSTGNLERRKTSADYAAIPTPKVALSAKDKAAQIAVESRSSMDLASGYVIGDPAATSELTRRAAAGDPEARNLLDAAIKTKHRIGGGK